MSYGSYGYRSGNPVRAPYKPLYQQFGDFTSSIYSYFGNNSTGIQIVLGIVIVAILYFAFSVSNWAVKSGQSYTSRFMYLIDNTNNASNGSITIFQNPLLHPTDAKTVGLSENERTGIEFAYSCFLLVDSGTFNTTGSETLNHVFHKGYQTAWPLMGPGVFVLGNTNTLRVIMNSYANPYNYVDIPNIPVKKWFHVVLNSYKNTLEVHINGSLVNRINFSDSNTIPYQNFGDIFVFNDANYVIKAPNGISYTVSGAMSGYISNLVYARYALSFTEIQKLLNMGPSKQIVTQTNPDVNNTPPYLSDTWWADSA
jgi:hypothetical protein